MRKGNVRAVQREFEGQIVDHFNDGVGEKLPRHVRIWLPAALQRPSDILGRDRAAIAELGVVVQFEGHLGGLLVEFVGLRQPRVQLQAVWRILHQRGEDLHLRPQRIIVVRILGIPQVDIRRAGNGQNAAALPPLCGRRCSRRCGRRRYTACQDQPDKPNNQPDTDDLVLHLLSLLDTHPNNPFKL